MVWCITLSMTSNTTVAEPRAVANVSSSGSALPSEKLPMMMAKNTVTTSPADSSQARMRVEPYLEKRPHYTAAPLRPTSTDLPETKSICRENDQVEATYYKTGEETFLEAFVPRELKLVTISAVDTSHSKLVLPEHTTPTHLSVSLCSPPNATTVLMDDSTSSATPPAAA